MSSRLGPALVLLAVTASPAAVAQQARHALACVPAPDAGATPAPPDTSLAAAGARVETIGSRLTVRLADAPLAEVLESIRDRAGFELRLSSRAAAARVTDAFDCLPLEAALRRLLGGWDHVLVGSGRGPDRRLEQVLVLSTRHQHVSSAGAARPASDESLAPGPIAIAEQLSARLEARVAEALPPGSGVDGLLEFEARGKRPDDAALEQAGIRLTPELRAIEDLVLPLEQ